MGGVIVEFQAAPLVRRVSIVMGVAVGVLVMLVFTLGRAIAAPPESRIEVVQLPEEEIFCEAAGEPITRHIAGWTHHPTQTAVDGGPDAGAPTESLKTHIVVTYWNEAGEVWKYQVTEMHRGFVKGGVVHSAATGRLVQVGPEEGTGWYGRIVDLGEASEWRAGRPTGDPDNTACEVLTG